MLTARFFRAALLAGLAVLCLHAEVKLPALISDHMLLQQGVPVKIWGSATPGAAVEVSFRDQKAAATAGAEGKWTVWLQPLRAGGPDDLTVTSGNAVTVRDVLVGDVWVGSGQSNMVWSVARSANPQEEMSNANYPPIRLFQVKTAVADQPADDVTGAWMVCNPDNVKDFSAVGYFFAREIHKARKVPVGVIQSAWGGTPAQSWTSRPAIERNPSLEFVLDAWQRVVQRYPAAHAAYEKQLSEWKPDSGTPRPRPPVGPGHQNTPGGLFNAMIAPLTPYAIRGVIWYQGENDASESHAYGYRHLFRALIEDWRQAWSNRDLPFLFVQLANFKTNGWWPLLRESQTEALGLRNTGMAVAVDIGDAKDIHPTNKQDVGRRLALAARRIAYGEEIEHSGPMFRELYWHNGRLHAWFDHAAGLKAKSGALAGFEVAGEDGVYHPAEAEVAGNSVALASGAVARPVAVRYGWSDDPACNLVNGAGLPASPFRAGERSR